MVTPQGKAPVKLSHCISNRLVLNQMHHLCLCYYNVCTHIYMHIMSVSAVVCGVMNPHVGCYIFIVVNVNFVFE